MIENPINFRFIFLVLVIIFCSCSSSDDQRSIDNINYNLSKVSTLPAQVNGSNVTLGLELTEVGENINGVGVCYSTQPNPTFQNQSVGGNAFEPGQYTFVATDLQSNTTYYAKGFANQGSIGIQYGNEISFTTGSNVTTNNVTHIHSRKATLNGYTIPNSSNLSSAGFVYGTLPNPTINNTLVTQTIVGASNYSIEIASLLPNTIYYVKAYNNGTYGEQVEFKTTGYTGPGGGYVAYDKGEFTDGWRYLELHPVSLEYNSYAIGSKWGAINTFLSGTSSQIGTGLANTSLIASTASEADCAAKLCQNLVLNGYSDWFLGSSEEMLLVVNSLAQAGHSFGGMWTSTQVNMDNAYTLFRLSSSEPFTISSLSYKGSNRYVYPLRRY